VSTFEFKEQRHLTIRFLALQAQVIQVHPLYLLIAPVIASSMAFMLPVATPPNAIAFSYGHIKVLDMVSPVVPVCLLELI